MLKDGKPTYPPMRKNLMQLLKHIETPSISQIPPQDELCKLKNPTKTIARQSLMITKDDWFNESLLTLLNG